MIKILEKWTEEIFFNDLLEKKIAKFNQAIGTAIWKLILAKQDDYYTKQDVVFQPAGFKKGEKNGR
jgi:hypothetical protein